MHGGLFSPAGQPDIIGHCRGVFFAIEVKRPGKKPTKLQFHALGRIISKGGVAIWLDDIESAKNLIAYIRTLKLPPILPYNAVAGNS